MLDKIGTEAIAGSEINSEADQYLKGFIGLSVCVIVVINYQIIRWEYFCRTTELTILDYRKLFFLNKTFINCLILLDSLNALCHIPVILQYFW